MDMSSTHIGEPEDVKPLGIADPRLCAVLQSLSLHEYTEALVAHGFTTWDQLLDIQEHHLEALKFKLGHRRKLQREIAVCKNIKSLKDQIERPQDGAELAAIHTPTIRPEKRRLDDTEQFQGMHKRFFGQGSLVNVEDDDGHCADGGSMSWLNRQMTLHSLISADPTALSSTSHFTVVKDRCSTISLRMPVMYGQPARQRSVTLSPTVAPRLSTGEVSLSLEPTVDLSFTTPFTEQADAWACSLLNLSPHSTQCDHTDISCDCWQDATLFPHEPTNLLHDQGSQILEKPFLSTALAQSSSSSSRSESAPSTNFEQSSEVRTRGTSCASVEAVEQYISKPKTMPMQPQTPLQEFPTLPPSVICVYILPKMADSNSQDTLHFAVYLKSRTLDEFIQLIANRCNMLSHQILRTIRIDKTGVEMAFNDTMVRQIMEEQVMIAEFRDIGLPPHFHPSFADVAGFGELKSRFFELRLRY